MNINYVIITHNLKKTHKDYMREFGKLSYLLDCCIDDEETKKSIDFTFSKPGLNKEEYYSTKYTIKRMTVIRKPKSV